MFPVTIITYTHIFYVLERMTSTNVNVGLVEGRLSSRVLKPPGGGHTDIFNARQNVEPLAAPVQNTSGNNENIASDSDSGKPLSNNNVKGIDVKQGNGATQAADKQPVDENVKPAEKKECPRRVRVPPGGFSSGLW